MSSLISQVRELEFSKADTWIAEAEFGFGFTSEEVNRLNANSNVLEIGCGSGLLLSLLAEKYPHTSFEGIEPFGDGFNSLGDLNTFVKKSGVNIKNIRYEDFKPDHKYDFIFCINVFEHLEDWRHMLSWSAKQLKPKGKLLVLCPNYSFPYESHFKLPILINKTITRKVFQNYIRKFEYENDTEKLWDSINFVKKKEVKSFIMQSTSANKLSLFDDTSVIDDIIDRILFDETFRKRQQFVGLTALLLKRLGMLRLIKKFPNLLPYMKLIFIKNQ